MLLGSISRLAMVAIITGANSALFTCPNPVRSLSVACPQLVLSLSAACQNSKSKICLWSVRSLSIACPQLVRSLSTQKHKKRTTPPWGYGSIILSRTKPKNIHKFLVTCFFNSSIIKLINVRLIFARRYPKFLRRWFRLCTRVGIFRSLLDCPAWLPCVRSPCAGLGSCTKRG